MDVQTLIAGALVAGCTAWAVWMLLPAGPRVWLGKRLGLKAPSTSAGACGGCSGCGGTAPGAPQRVTIVRRPGA